MIEFIIGCIGLIFLWAAVHLNRDEDTKINLFSKHGIVAIVFVTLGTYIYSNSERFAEIIERIIQQL